MADVTSQTLRPSLNSYYQTLEDAQLWLTNSNSEAQSLLFASQFNTVDSPIVGDDISGGGKTTIVQRTTSLQVGGSWLIYPDFQIGTDLGLHVVQIDDRTSYFGIGDIHIMGKKNLLRSENNWGLSASPDFFIPINNNHSFLSNGTTGFGGRFFLEKSFNGIGIVGNAGYLKFPGATYRTIHYETQYPMGLGLRIQIGPKVAFNFEGTTSVLPNHGLTDGPGDFYAGGRVTIFKGGILSLGGSYGAISLDDSASVRILARLDVLPRTTEPIKVIEKTTTKQIQTLHDCKPKNYSVSLKGRSVGNEDMDKIGPLPFLTLDRKQFKTVYPGHKTGFKNGAPYVKNAQVIFAIDLFALPKRSDIISIEALNLKMNVNKLNDSHDPRSGMLCLLNDKVCSGDLPNSKKQRDNMNGAFFKGKEPPNDFFMREIQHESDGDIFSKNLTLPLEKLIENSIVVSPQELIYEDHDEARRTLYFVVARDIYVKDNIQLEVLFTINSCTTIKTETVSEPQSTEMIHDEAF